MVRINYDDGFRATEARIKAERIERRLTPRCSVGQCWYLGICNPGTEEACEERVQRLFPSVEPFVLLGQRASCPRSDWPDVRLETYSPLAGYIFLRCDFERLRVVWLQFFGSTRIQRLHVTGDKPTPIPDGVMHELFKRQAAGEWSNYLAAAREHFGKMIGKSIRLPEEHPRWPGVEVVIVTIVGDVLKWRFELFGQATEGSIKLSKLWPKNYEARVLELGEQIKLFTKPADVRPQADLKLPAPPIN